MFKTFSLAFLASASFLGAGLQQAAAQGYQYGAPVYYANEPAPRPMQRAAYAERPRRNGGGFIEFLFSDGPQDQPSQQLPTYEPRRGGLLQQGYEPRQAMRQDIDPAQPAMDPKYQPQMVDYSGSEKPGTIVVDTPNKFLFLVQGNGQAMRYGIGVGKPGFTWSGVKTITAKKEWPAWTPPPEMLVRRPDLPRHMEGGPENPLGARAMYLGSTLYRIHGSNEPWTIGTNVSSGCIRMRNEDVIDLYGRVNVGAKVIVI